MRCPNCGAILCHCLTDVHGNNYYQCTQNLTTQKRLEKADNGTHWSTMCGAITDARGHHFTGLVITRDGDKKLHDHRLKSINRKEEN